RSALEGVVADARERRTAVMCSESVWWRCHRRIVADVVAAHHGMPVGHLMHDGRITDHSPSEGLRIDESGWPVWNGAPTDRKSTRLNSSHVSISYAVFCLKKKY